MSSSHRLITCPRKTRTCGQAIIIFITCVVLSCSINQGFHASGSVGLQVLDALALVGLRDTLTIDVMADAAKALQNEDAGRLSASTLERAMALFGQLDQLAISQGMTCIWKLKGR